MNFWAEKQGRSHELGMEPRDNCYRGFLIFFFHIPFLFSCSFLSLTYNSFSVSKAEKNSLTFICWRRRSRKWQQQERLGDESWPVCVVTIAWPGHNNSHWWQRLRLECVHVRACVLGGSIWLFATPWTVACEAPLSLEFSQKEGIFPTQGSNSCFLHCRRILYHGAIREDPALGSPHCGWEHSLPVEQQKAGGGRKE